MFCVEVSYDPAKREATLRQRGLDFVDAPQLFEPPSYTVADDRHDYGKPRYLTFGLLAGREAMVACTPTDKGSRVISMRKCNGREQANFAARAR